MSIEQHPISSILLFVHILTWKVKMMRIAMRRMIVILIVMARNDNDRVDHDSDKDDVRAMTIPKIMTIIQL